MKRLVSFIFCAAGELLSFTALWCLYRTFIDTVPDSEFDPGYLGFAVFFCIAGLIGYPVGLNVIRAEFDSLSERQAVILGLKTGIVGFWGMLALIVGQGFATASLVIYFVRQIQDKGKIGNGAFQ